MYFAGSISLKLVTVFEYLYGHTVFEYLYGHLYGHAAYKQKLKHGN